MTKLLKQFVKHFQGLRFIQFLTPLSTIVQLYLAVSVIGGRTWLKPLTYCN